tara:strand:- start:128 stop:385 length:258 start_codon:yes stop_codon:yes gene_type:complete
MEDFEEVNFSHEGKDYYVKIEIYDHDQWKVMKVCKYDEPEIWEDMQIVSAELTKVMVIAIEKYVSTLDGPHVPSDYDYKDLIYDR